MSISKYHTRIGGCSTAKEAESGIEVHKLLELISTNSPYLKLLAGRHPDVPRAFDKTGANATISTLLQAIDQLDTGLDASTFAMELRLAKQRVHLLLALADLGGIWDCATVTRQFSKFADLVLNKAFEQVSKASSHDLKKAGLFIVAFGKLAGGELNYSSDIDIGLFYDAERAEANVKDAQVFIGAGRKLIALLSDVSEFGYVFRTDLRLRPDPASTPIALSTEAALNYYENIGQTWERAVWIKARIVAGNIESGERLLQSMKPFVWRKYMDFAAIDDILAMRNQRISQINATNEPARTSNVKLMPNGIREIELFIQSRQLIHGGRVPQIRSGPSMEALSALCIAGLVSSAEQEILQNAYYFYRNIEHSAQMFEDHQTHHLPSGEMRAAKVSALAGYENAKDLLEAIEQYAASVGALVEKHDLQQGSADKDILKDGADRGGNFLSTDWLQQTGFQNPILIQNTIRDWQYGSIRATRSDRARRLMMQLLPGFLKTISGYDRPDVVFAKFASFVTHLPSGIQILSLFAHCPQITGRLIELLALSDVLGNMIAKKPHLMEVFLEETDPDWLESIFPVVLQNSHSLEQMMNTARKLGKEHQFRTASKILGGDFDAGKAGVEFSRLARICIQELGTCIQQDLTISDQPGPVEWAILGFGKLGSNEMGLASDIDLVVIYQDQTHIPQNRTPGFDAAQWALRFTRRLVSSLSAPTEEGTLYEVDLALRPSGKSGPVAVNFQSFCAYYLKDAWSWEYYALSRASVIAASSDGFASQVATELIRLCGQWKRLPEMKTDMQAMRKKLHMEKQVSGRWDLKRGTGGMLDMDLLLQHIYLYSGLHETTSMLKKAWFPKQAEAISAGLAKAEYRELQQIHKLFHQIYQVLSVTMGASPSCDELHPSLAELLVQSSGCESLDELERGILYARKQIDKILSQLLMQ